MNIDLFNKKILKFSNSNISFTEEEQEQLIKDATIKYGEFLDALHFSWRDDPNASNTPYRVAKMWVKEIAKGCYNTPPKITVFDNVDNYTGIVFQGDIDITSLCAHHHQTITGKAYVAYIPSETGKIVGLSKLNRVVDYFARRPQVQENLTNQIASYLDNILLDNLGIAVMIKGKHGCVKNRGIQQDSTMVTTKLLGAFLTEEKARSEFYKCIDNIK